MAKVELTTSLLMQTFFKELQQHGQLDQAMAAARYTVRERSDWWMPLLFMRLRSGRIWYKPGFQQTEKAWPALLANIDRQRCTPVIGPGMSESLLGSHREIAQRWAETYNFPIAPPHRQELHQVAQFLASKTGHMFARDELMDYLHRQLVHRCKDELPKEMLAQYGNRLEHRERGTSLNELLSVLGSQRRQQNQMEPYKVLASLPLPIYITTNPDPLLFDALEDAKKEPQIEFCRWSEELEQFSSIFDKEPDYEPTPKRPLVYQLFGSFKHPDSMVLTVDDYFNFLMRVTANRDLIPSPVGQALDNTSLLFLGLQMDDWNFRIPLLIKKTGGKAGGYYDVVVLPLTKEEDMGQKERHFEDYYFKDTTIIYQGSPENFAQELRQEWQKRQLDK